MKKLEGNSKENAKITLEVLSGEKSVYRDTVLLNAGLALFANGKRKRLKKELNSRHIALTRKSISQIKLINCSKQRKIRKGELKWGRF